MGVDAQLTCEIPAIGGSQPDITTQKTKIEDEFEFNGYRHGSDPFVSSLFVPATPNAGATQAEFEHGFCGCLEL